MMIAEEKIVKYLKLTILLLITLLGVSLTDEIFMAVMLLFYIAFMKE
jgi:hypothetical protein